MLRVSDVAKRLNCSVKTIYAEINSGRLGHHRCPGIRVSEEQLKAYLDATKSEGTVGLQQPAVPARVRLRHISLRR